MESIEIISTGTKTAFRLKGVNTVVRQPLHSILCIDTSASMDSDNKLKNVIKSLQIFVKCLVKGDAISLITFDEASVIKLTKVEIDEVSRGCIDNVIMRIKTGGSTNLSAGLLNTFACMEVGTARKQNVILLTDGYANAGETSTVKLIELTDRFYKMHTDITMTVVAYGLNHNADLLKGLTEAGRGSYNLVGNLEDVGSVFGSILGSMLSVICQNTSIKFSGPATIASSHSMKETGGLKEILIGDIHSEESIVVVLDNAVPDTSYTIEYMNIQTLETTTTVQKAILGDAPVWMVLTLNQQYVAKLIAKAASKQITTRELEVEIASMRQSVHADTVVMQHLILELEEIIQMMKNRENYTIAESDAHVSMLQRSCVVGLARGQSTPGRATTNDPLAPQNEIMRSTSQYVRGLTQI